MDRTPYPSETQDRFIVRFPDGMRDRLKEAAHANGRSMNAEIVARLQDTFNGSAVRERDELLKIRDLVLETLVDYMKRDEGKAGRPPTEAPKKEAG